MKISIHWCGFDMGGTLMDPSGNYQCYVDIINEIYTKLGRPEVISEKLARFDELIAEHDYDENLMDGIVHNIEFWKRHYRLKRLQETNIEKLFSHVFDNDPHAIEFFRERNFDFLKPPDGLKECLEYLKSKGISINIVSDVGSEGMLKSYPKFLSSYGLATYFSEIITNFGRIKNNGDIDLSYKGLDKTNGAIYKKLARDLLDIGIKPSQALIIGDRPIEDIDKAKENGFHAIQYVGIMHRKVSNVADYVISDFRELIEIL